MSSIVLNLPPIKFYKKLKSGKQEETCSAPSINVSAFVVDFGRFLKKQSTVDEIVHGIPNTDLLHAAATLYGISLSEVTDDIIYSTLCEKWSKTILLVLDEDQAESRLKKNLKDSSKKIEENAAIMRTRAGRSLEERQEQLKKVDEDRFVNIFSDDDVSDDDATSDSDGVDDVMDGITLFLRAVDERREARQRCFVENLQPSNLQLLNYKRWMKEHFGGCASESRFPVGIENRLVACATFERSYQRPGEKIIQLTLLAVRRKYRRLGIGSYIIKQLLNPVVTGGSDVIVVNADHEATDFFESNGFSDDVILNSRYAHIGDVWFNSKRMCYLEGFTSGGDHEGDYFKLRDIDLGISLWKEKSTQSYQQFASIIHRMRKEILSLHARIGLQAETILQLQRQLDTRNDQIFAEEQDRMREKIRVLRVAIDSFHEQTTDHWTRHSAIESRPSSSAHDVASTSSSYNATSLGEKVMQEYDDGAVATSSQTFEDDVIFLAKFADADDAIDGEVDNINPNSDVIEIGQSVAMDIGSNLTPETSRQLTDSETTASHKMSVTDVGPSASADVLPASVKEDLQSLFSHEIKHCFLNSMNDHVTTSSGRQRADVTDIDTVEPPSKVVSSFNDVVASSRDADVIATLYYCGGTSDLEKILRRGFVSSDAASSDYGRGLHFSRHAPCATHFSPPGKVLVAKVCLGRTATVTSKDPSRISPPEGSDSVLTPGRLWEAGGRNAAAHSEYIVFNARQALPIALINYRMLW